MFPSIPTYAISPDLRSMDLSKGLWGMRSLLSSEPLSAVHAVVKQQTNITSSIYVLPLSLCLTFILRFELFVFMKRCTVLIQYLISSENVSSS